jgi:hypothetical protein
VEPAPGGRHESIGTHNAILPLADGAYVELMAKDPTNPRPDGGMPFGLGVDAGPRLATWAAGTSDIDAAVEASRTAGYDPGVVVDLARDTPEGDHLTWRLTIARELAFDGLVPFLIDWGTTPHPSRSAPARCSIESFRAEHPEAASLRTTLRALGCSIDVDMGPRPSLFATIVGPDGRMDLSPDPK